MAIYGKLDGKAFANTIAVTQNDATVTKNAADSIEVGDVLDILGVAYIVKTVTSTTSIELHKVYAGSTNNAVSAASVLRRTPPRAVAEFVIKGGDTNSYELLFVDDTEKDIAANKTRGITGPGWWQYRTHTDVSGATRHKAECLAFVHASASDAGDDSDDTIAADVQNTITFSTNNTDKTTSGGAATFVVAVSVTNSGTASFQWQKRASSSGRFANVSGATATSLALTGQTAAEDGNQYRVKVTSNNGAPEVISDVATLTFGS
jgi:hypothetical protein